MSGAPSTRSSRRCPAAARRRRTSSGSWHPRRRSRFCSTGAPPRGRRARSSSLSATCAPARCASPTPPCAPSRLLAPYTPPSSPSSVRLRRPPPPLACASPTSPRTLSLRSATRLLASPRRARPCIWCLIIWRWLGAGTRVANFWRSSSASTISSVCRRSCSST